MPNCLQLGALHACSERGVVRHASQRPVSRASPSRRTMYPVLTDGAHYEREVDIRAGSEIISHVLEVMTVLALGAAACAIGQLRQGLAVSSACNGKQESEAERVELYEGCMGDSRQDCIQQSNLRLVHAPSVYRDASANACAFNSLETLY
jgi:hypothetical protein